MIKWGSTLRYIMMYYSPRIKGQKVPTPQYQFPWYNFVWLIVQQLAKYERIRKISEHITHLALRYYKMQNAWDKWGKKHRIANGAASDGKWSFFLLPPFPMWPSNININSYVLCLITFMHGSSITHGMVHPAWKILNNQSPSSIMASTHHNDDRRTHPQCNTLATFICGSLTRSGSHAMPLSYEIPEEQATNERPPSRFIFPQSGKLYVNRRIFYTRIFVALFARA